MASRAAAHTASMVDNNDPGKTAEPDARSKRFERLPERIKLEDTVESQETDPARDPEGGRDTNRDFMIRYLGEG
jgi:hypothetical protein